MWPLRRIEQHPRVSGCNWDKPCKTPSKSEHTSLFLDGHNFLRSSIPHFLSSFPLSRLFWYRRNLFIEIASLPIICPSNRRPCPPPYSYSFTLKAFRQMAFKRFHNSKECERIYSCYLKTRRGL